MYNAYVGKLENPSSRKIYEWEFYVLKLTFKKPRVYTCHKCYILNMQTKITTTGETSIIESEIKNHQESTDLPFKTKENDQKKLLK